MAENTDLYTFIEDAITQTETHNRHIASVVQFVQANHNDVDLQQSETFSRLYEHLKVGPKLLQNRELSDLIASFYSDQKLLRYYYDSLSQEHQQILYRLTWEGVLSYEIAQHLFGTDLFENKPGQFGQFNLKSDYSHLAPFIYWIGSGYVPSHIKTLAEKIIYCKTCLMMPVYLRKAYSMILEKPQKSELTPIKLPNHWQVYNFEQDIYEELPRIINYLQNGQIKENQKGQLNIPSLKAVQKKLALKSFPNDCGYIKALMLAGFTNTPPEGTNPVITAQLITEVFLNTMQITFRMLEPLIFPYSGLRTVTGLYCGGPAYDSLFNLTKMLPAGQWITPDNLERYASCNIMSINLINEDLIRELTPGFTGSAAIRFKESHPFQKQIMITQQAITSVMLIAASLGLVELAYDPDCAELYPHSPKDMHQGLFSACRLTALGEHALQGRKDYIPPATARPTSYQWDELSQTLQVTGNLPLIAEQLKRWTKELTTDHALQLDIENIQITCSDKEALISSIQELEQTLLIPMPDNWKKQLMELVYNSEQVRPLFKASVYKLSPYDKKLHRLVIQDPMLSKLSLKGEDFTLIVELYHEMDFLDRMAELGYILETPSTFKLKDMHFNETAPSARDFQNDFDKLIKKGKIKPHF